MEQLDTFKDTTLVVEDRVVDTESNLWYIVLQKNLYKIGLPIDMFGQYCGEINALVNRRNSIAHGNARAGVEQQEFLNWETKISLVLSEVTRLLYDYAIHQKYLQSNNQA